MITSFGEERDDRYASRAVVWLFCTRYFLSFFSSSWYRWLATACDCGTPWTCILTFLNISCKNYVTNLEVRSRIQNTIGVHDDLLTMVKKRKLRRYGHISRSSGMAKTILPGTVKGTRMRGRRKKRWKDNIKEWTWIGFRDSLWAAEDREMWKGIIATSSVVSDDCQG